MNGLLEHQPVRTIRDRDYPAGAHVQAMSWIWITAFLLLCGFLLFAHGCHGDEDTELFSSAITSRER
jgi:hypothetical protein